jgi:hypothetical protein
VIRRDRTLLFQRACHLNAEDLQTNAPEHLRTLSIVLSG